MQVHREKVALARLQAATLTSVAAAVAAAAPPAVAASGAAAAAASINGGGSHSHHQMIAETGSSVVSSAAATTSSIPGAATKTKAIGDTPPGAECCMYICMCGPPCWFVGLAEREGGMMCVYICMYICMYICNVCMYTWTAMYVRCCRAFRYSLLNIIAANADVFFYLPLKCHSDTIICDVPIDIACRC